MYPSTVLSVAILLIPNIVNAHDGHHPHDLVKRSTLNGPCTGAGGAPGVCISTASCTSDGGTHIQGACSGKALLDLEQFYDTSFEAMLTPRPPRSPCRHPMLYQNFMRQWRKLPLLQHLFYWQHRCGAMSRPCRIQVLSPRKHWWRNQLPSSSHPTCGRMQSHRCERCAKDRGRVAR